MATRFKPVSSQVDFIAAEKELLDFWYKQSLRPNGLKEGIIEKYLHRNDSSEKKFSFLDGPITANNPMGVHHAWGRTYKDLWQRFYNMKGFKGRFQNGFDEQGLWVEVEVEKELGLKSKKDIENLVPGDKFASLEKFIGLCKERVKKYSGVQAEQSKRLGYFMDWDNSYHTSSDRNNFEIWNFLKVVNEKGWLYKGHDSVPWCPRCGTAISQHEILTEDYKSLTHMSVVLKFSLSDGAYILAWTTTPWSIPGTIALMVNPEMDYVRVKQEDGEYILAKERITALKGSYKILDTFRGTELVGKTFTHPYADFPALKGQKFPVIPSTEFVTASIGTGVVTNNPGVGHEDYLAAKAVNLLPVESIDEAAHFLEGFSWLSGKYAKNSEVINQILKEVNENGFVYDMYNFVHQYPVCWRCKSELVFRIVDEWYIGVDKQDDSGETYREQMTGVAKEVNWIPKWGLDRELDWLKNMQDWLISKKRYWGLALPIWECDKCENFEVIGGIEELEQRAVEGWERFKGHSPHKPWIDQVKIECSKCGGTSSRIPDVGNPWLDAGIVPFSTMPEGWFPADFVTEAFPGQFKNWFYSLIAMSTALKRTTPYKNLLGHALVIDEKGEPMHKSSKNFIPFDEGAEKIGVDVMRWIYCSQNPENNLPLTYELGSEVRRRLYLILWNSYKFFVDYANLSKEEIKQIGDVGEVGVLDRWISSRLNKVILEVNNYLEKYDAATSSRMIEDFVINDLSTWYIRRSRDRVGPGAQKADEQAFLSTLDGVLVTLSKLLAPFMPFISEMIYQNLTDEESVHLADYPQARKELIDEELIKQMALVRKLVEMGHALRKEASIKLRQPLQKFTYLSKEKLDDELEKIMADELNVKQIEHKTTSVEATGELDTKITPELQAEGNARELARQIQQLRKEMGLTLKDKIKVIVPQKPENPDLLDMVLKQTNAVEISTGEKLEITVAS